MHLPKRDLIHNFFPSKTGMAGCMSLIGWPPKNSPYEPFDESNSQSVNCLARGSVTLVFFVAGAFELSFLTFGMSSPLRFVGAKL